MRELVAACVAEVLERLLSMNPGEEGKCWEVLETIMDTCWEVLETLLSVIRGGAVKIGGDAGVRELVAASVAEALETLLAAAVEEKAQRKKLQHEKAQRERLE